MKRIYLLVFWTLLPATFLVAPDAVLAVEKSGMTEPNAVITPTSSPAKPDEDISKTLGLKFSGDIDFRFEYFVQGQDYAPTYAATPSASFIDHDVRYRIRARVGVEKTIGQEAIVGVRLATGNPADPTNDFMTLNSGVNFVSPLNNGVDFNGILLDRVYIDWAPRFLDKKVSVTMGRFANPLEISPLTWDEAVSPEGVALVLKPGEDTKFSVLYFTLDQNPPSTTVDGFGADPFLAQFQLEQKLKLSDAEVAVVAGYEYVSNVSAFETGDAAAVTAYFSNPANPPGAPLSITNKGMVGDASQGDMIPEMHIVEGMLKVHHTLGEEKIPVDWTFHGAYNLSSFNITAQTNTSVSINNPGENASNALALYAGVHAGKTGHGGDWAGGLEWGYIEPNSVFAAYNAADSDIAFGHNNHTWFKGLVEAGLDNDFVLSIGQYWYWRVNYDVLGTAPSNIFDMTSRDPVLRTQIDLSAKL
jgi:hypothetical protein